MTELLDRVVWNALNTTHAGFAEGNGAALRYSPSIIPFAAMRDNSTESLDALAALCGPNDDRLVLVEKQAAATPDGLKTSFQAELIQMVADSAPERVLDPRIMPLKSADAEEMRALAALTKPGPFTLRAQELGIFWGVRLDGRLVAMAGQRMRVPGCSELSGLCTHPDFQGQGLGRLLLRFVAGEIAARGETPFLHSYADNAIAVSLYESAGFRKRASFQLSILERE